MKTKLLFIILLISTSIFAQNGDFPLVELLNIMETKPNTSHFEVSGEMFKMMSEANGSSEEFKQNIQKLSSLKVIRTTSSEKSADLYNDFMKQVNLSDYKMLMKSSQPEKKMVFYKKENKNSENEYLLVSSDIIIYLTGTIDIKSLQEMDAIMNIAGQALHM